jgi:predicted dehydrogenase
MINVGIVGLGKMGILHAGIVNALPDNRVTAICEKEGILTRAARKILPGISFYEDAVEMMQKESLDAVFIASPIHTHAAVIRRLLESGCNTAMFTEKPLAANETDALEIADAVTNSGIVNMVGFQKRFSQTFQHAKRLLSQGAIGELQCFRCYSYMSDIFRQGKGWRFEKGTGGVLLEHGPHLLDLMLWYFGEPETVSAVERAFYSSEVEDYVHAFLEFSSRLVGTLDLSWSIRNYRLPETFIEVHGTNGVLTVNDDYVRVQVDHPVDGVVDAGRRTLQKPEFNSSVDFLLGDPEFTSEDKCFLGAVKTGDQVEPSFRTAARVNRLIGLIQKEGARSH